MIDDELHTIEVTTRIGNSTEQRAFNGAYLIDKHGFLKVIHGDKECWFNKGSVVRVRLGPNMEDE